MANRFWFVLLTSCATFILRRHIHFTCCRQISTPRVLSVSIKHSSNLECLLSKPMSYIYSYVLLWNGIPTKKYKATLTNCYSSITEACVFMSTVINLSPHVVNVFWHQQRKRKHVLRLAFWKEVLKNLSKLESTPFVFLFLFTDVKNTLSNM